MENASKALIIAGAILLSILLISLGIIIYNQATGVINNNAMNEADIQIFNQKFTQYEGEKVKGSVVNTMLQAVLGNNMSQDDDDRKIDVTGGEVTLNKKDTSIKDKANTGGTYIVKCSYSNAGLVSEIKVTKNK